MPFILPSFISTSINIYGFIAKSSNSEKLLGVTIERYYKYEEHINSLCQKSSQKLNALSTISQYLSQNKREFCLKRL